jgi:hypothetical protein
MALGLAVVGRILQPARPLAFNPHWIRHPAGAGRNFVGLADNTTDGLERAKGGRLVERGAGSFVVVVAVLAVFGPTSNVIAPAGNELSASALFASTVSVLDGFLGIVDAVLFDVFTPRPLLFAARSLFGGFRSHRILSGLGCRGIVEERGSAIVVSQCPV